MPIDLDGVRRLLDRLLASELPSSDCELLAQLADEVERGKQTSAVPTVWAYERVCKANDAKRDEIAKLREAGAKLNEAFELGIFVRDLSGDDDPRWAIKLLPYLRALAVLVKDVSESESTKNQEENDG
jgi:hypothetical protein